MEGLCLVSCAEVYFVQAFMSAENLILFSSFRVLPALSKITVVWKFPTKICSLALFRAAALSSFCPDFYILLMIFLVLDMYMALSTAGKS